MRAPGFEPGTYRVSVDCSSHLSYARTRQTNLFSKKFLNDYVNIPEKRILDKRTGGRLLLATLYATPKLLLKHRRNTPIPQDHLEVVVRLRLGHFPFQTINFHVVSYQSFPHFSIGHESPESNLAEDQILDK